MFEVTKLPKPDEMGFFFHPDIPGEDESDDVRQLCKDLGFDAAAVSMETDAPDLYDAWTEDEDMAAPSRWTPTPPAGNGWALVSVYDTEDGPYAMFVQPLDATDIDWDDAQWRAQTAVGQPAPIYANGHLVHQSTD